MKKFTANYLVSDTGVFLKNGIVIAGENGTPVEFIDTAGDLKEIESLVFHNGILFAGFRYIKVHAALPFSEFNNPVRSFISGLSAGSSQLTIQELIGFGKQLQEQLQELKIPEIIYELQEALLVNGGYVKEDIPGLFLLTGVDLPNLHFTPKTRLKKIL
jgi:hypothetical protein